MVVTEEGVSLMAGDLLSISQICALSGLDERSVKKSLSGGRLLDQSPEQVGRWLMDVFESKINRNNGRSASRQDREPLVHRKWD